MFITIDDRYFCVVLQRPTTLFVVAALHERAVHWTIHNGDTHKIACIWIKGKRKHFPILITNSEIFSLRKS